MSALKLVTYARRIGVEVKAVQGGKYVKHLHDRAAAEDLYRHGATVTRCPPDSAGESFEVSFLVDQVVTSR